MRSVTSSELIGENRISKFDLVLELLEQIHRAYDPSIEYLVVVLKAELRLVLIEETPP